MSRNDKDFDVDQIRTENLIVGMLRHHGLETYLRNFRVEKRARRCSAHIKLNGRGHWLSLPYDGQTIVEIERLHILMEEIASKVKEYGGIS